MAEGWRVGTNLMPSLRGANGSARTRGPMTGSATKQSMLCPQRRCGLLRFARNDEGTIPRSRDMKCPGYARCHPQKSKGAGNAGRRCTRGLVCSNNQENAHELITGTTEHVRHSPRDV